MAWFAKLSGNRLSKSGEIKYVLRIFGATRCPQLHQDAHDQRWAKNRGDSIYFPHIKQKARARVNKNAFNPPNPTNPWSTKHPLPCSWSSTRIVCVHQHQKPCHLPPDHKVAYLHGLFKVVASEAVLGQDGSSAELSRVKRRIKGLRVFLRAKIIKGCYHMETGRVKSWQHEIIQASSQ